MDIKKIKQLIKLVEDSNIASLKIQEDSQEIEITKAHAPSQSQTVMLPASTPAAVAPVAPPPVAAAASPQPSSDAQAKSTPASSDNLIPIKSPMVGTFYAAASPEEKPYVSVGSSVQKGQTVCIIEAMKLFNEIEAETSGKIVEICAQNGDAIEFGQTLFLVELA